MSKYDGLGAFLRKQRFCEVPMTFSEIERVTGAQLPPKAQHHAAWWSNNPSNNVMTKIWLAAGYRTAQVDIPGRKLLFRRASDHPPRNAGMAETVREVDSPPRSEAGSAPHPLVGAMKGTFTIESGYDLTSPAFEPDELANLDASIESTATMMERGLSGKA